ncbi:MAG: HAMP domain-containing protein [Alphaproteobacteria bacterium]|nr:HAMP domain-containing protein [Alphaproteobacteria bacterium]
MTALDPAETSARRVLRLLGSWSSRRRLARFFAISLSVAAAAAGIATYAVFTQSTLGPGAPSILILLNIDLVILLLLGFVVAHRVVKIWSARRRGSAGSQLHVRLAQLFGLISVAPAIIVAVFSALFFNFGLESWFSDKIRTALKESEAVADAYLEEHKRNIVADALRMARDLDNQAFGLQRNQKRLISAVNLQARVRQLTEAIVFTGSGDVIARSGLTGALEFEPVPREAFKTALSGEVAVLTSGSEDRVRALIRLSNFGDSYLYVGRYVDPVVLGHSQRTKGAVAQFERLELNRADLQISFALIFVVVALLLLLAAVWVGLNFATSMSRPVSALIAATEKVRAGNLSARVVVDSASGGEVDTLGRAFNRMTGDLEQNRRELIEANQQIDARRVFTETVLSGVSAGVVGLDAGGRITLPNRSASQLLGIELDHMQGEPLAEVAPEFRELLAQAGHLGGDRILEQEVAIARGAESRTLLVRVGAMRSDDEIKGFVVSFDDVSALLSAQRKAAWADVARRIAHEIKNPLTPIQLSAERLKRRYLKQVPDDAEVFQTCIETIVRQVESIGRMVDEFSSFARMPAPVFRPESISELCRQAVFLQRNTHRAIAYEETLPDTPLVLNCDGRQISQAVTNLLQNAADAIEGRNDDEPGKIALELRHTDGECAITVCDNGIGLPAEDRESLTEPYVTTRAKGTGLGLAIVRKIMEDHKGRLLLEDGAEGGARVSLVFPDTVIDRGEAEPARTEQASSDGA